MHKLILLVLISIGQLTYSQKKDRMTYIFKSYEDYKNNSGEYIGETYDIIFGPVTEVIMYRNIKGKDKKLAYKNNWGLKIGEHLFRIKSNSTAKALNSRAQPSRCYYIEEKSAEGIFYKLGILKIREILNLENDNSPKAELMKFALTSIDVKMYFKYSETLDSKMMALNKISDKEKLSLEKTECLKKSMDRFDWFSIYDNVLNCIKNGKPLQNQTKDSLKRNTHVFKTLEDFKAGNKTRMGTYVSNSWSSSGGNRIHCELNRVENKVNTNQYWGFSIGDHVYRSKKGSPKIPVEIMGIKEKVFYVNGYFSLNKLTSGYAESSRTSENLFYSDNLGSKLYSTSNLLKKEKNNPKLKDLCSCIKNIKSTDYQGFFDKEVDCIIKHIEN